MAKLRTLFAWTFATGWLLACNAQCAEEYRELKKEIDQLNQKVQDLETTRKQETEYAKQKLKTLDSIAERVKFHGFLSAGYSTLEGDSSNHDFNLLGIRDTVTSQADMIIGTQFDVSIQKDLRASVQFVSRGIEENTVHTEWAYVAYNVNDKLTLRGGRLRIPFYAYSESLDVAYTYPWVRPPVNVYYLPLNNFEGFDFLYDYDVGAYWQGQVQGFIGSAVDDDPNFTNSDFSLHDAGGIVFSFMRDKLSLRAAYHQAKTSLEPHADGVADQLISGLLQAETLANGLNQALGQPRFDTAYAPDLVDTIASFATLAMVYDGDWFLATEYTKFRSDSEISPAGEGGYFSVGHHFGKWLPYLTYATVYTDARDDKPVNKRIANLTEMSAFLSPLGDLVIDPTTGTTAAGAATDLQALVAGLKQLRLQQSSYTAGIGYTVTEGLKVKTEGTHFNNFGESSGLFSDGLPGDSQTVYSLVINAVF